MKQGWAVKSLGELADVKGGKRVPKGYRLETLPTGFPYIRVTDFNDNGSVDLGDIHYIQKEVFNQIKKYTITSNDLYISIAGTIGKTGIIPKELDGANLTENACKLVFKENVNPKFIYYFTKTEDFINQAGLNTRVAAMPKLALTRLSTIRLSFPDSIAEQHRIVTILDEAFTSIAKAKENAEKNLANAREVFETYLQNVFANHGEGWVEKRLMDLSEVKDGTHDSPQYLLEGIPFVTQKNIKEEGLTLIDTKFISQMDHENFFRRSNATYGDLIISMIGANRGMACFVDSDKIFSIKNVGLVKKSENVNQHYLLFYLKSPMAKGYIQTCSKGGAQEFVGLTELRNFPIILPPSNEQLCIVAKLDSLSAETKKLETIYKQKLVDLDELKKSILEKAFAGKL